MPYFASMLFIGVEEICARFSNYSMQNDYFLGGNMELSGAVAAAKKGMAALE